MGYMDEYYKLKKKQEEEKKSSAKASNKGNDSYMTEYRTALPENNKNLRNFTKNLVENMPSGYVRGNGVSKTTSKEDERSWFQSGAFEDGYQFGDVVKTLLGTVGDVGVNVVKGVGRLGEGIVDLIQYGGAYVADWVGDEEGAATVRKFADKNLVDTVFEPVDDFIDPYSVLGEKSDSVAEGLGQVGAIIATGGVGGTALTTGTLFASGVGSGISEARQLGYEGWDALKHGLNVGATDAVSELVFGGLGKGAKALGVGRGLTSLDDMFAKAASSKFKSQITKNIVEWGIKSGAEGLEEVGAGIAQAISKSNLTDEEFLDVLADENLFEQFMVGAITSGIAQAPGKHGVINVTKSGQDFITGLTQNEQTVANKVYESELAEKEKNGELSRKEKNKLYDEVVKKMEKGYIGTDTIESVLGGESYKGYQSLVDEETSLKKEKEALENTPESQFTIKQRNRLNEINKRLDEIDTKTAKSKLFTEVDKLTANDPKLRESYNERVRATQDFKADFEKYKGTKYEDAAKKTLESAIKAGANNTNAVHDLVDMAAHLSSETGHIFDFKSNEDIKKDFIARQTKEIAKFEALENRTAEQDKYLQEMKDQLAKVQSGELVVDGDITGDNIVLNIDSAKPLNRITGHEVTHSLEQAKSYEALRDTIFAYAKSKGVDTDAQIKLLEQKYKGIEDANPEAELVANLVGDYLFTDSDFINNLSTSNRSLAQRIYDQIKHLCKLATAGSKEARELERVKYAFENAFREAEQAQKNTADSGVKYSLLVKDKNGNVSVINPYETTKDQSSDFIVKSRKGELNQYTYFPVSAHTPGTIIATLNNAGIEVTDKPLAMQAKKARQSQIDGQHTEPDGTVIRHHAMSTDEIQETIDKLNDAFSVIHQTERTKTIQEDGKNIRVPAPDNFVFFVTLDSGKECVAVIEFDSVIDKDMIQKDGYGDDYHTTVTVFEPDKYRDGEPFDYLEYLAVKPTNHELEIIKESPKAETAISQTEATVSEMELSGTKVTQDNKNVNAEFSLNTEPMTAKEEVKYSLSNDTAYMDKAIAKNNSSFLVNESVLEETKAMRERIASKLKEIKSKGLVGLPEDIEGNTYIANSSYDGTEENTTICPRSLASEAFVDAVSEYLGRPLSVEEQIYISQDLQGRSLTPECTYCYVATDRKAYRAFLGDYISQRDAVLQKVKDNPDADVSRNGDLYNEFLDGRKDTKPMYSRFKMWVDSYKNGTPMIEASHLANVSKLMGDINSEFGAELKPQIVDAMKYAQSASWAKKRVNYVAYNGHILNWKQDRINKLNSHYGLRMYSFSDFHPAFVLENMQMVTDASVRGLKMLGYTKDIDFVEIFAPSGMNINVSTFGFESAGDVFENNIIGAEWEKAKALREKYPNVGVTFVATNDTLVNWALDQDWIDVVIPYHLVRTGAEVAKAFNYTNYTSESSDTKDVGWTKGTDKKYIAPTEHNNDKATYLDALSKNHLKPRFERFVDNPNYMKLVNECRQPASESKPVQPVFNEDAAMSALAKLETNGYYQPIGGSVERMYEIAGEVAEAMTKEIAPTQHSLSERSDDIAPIGNYDFYGKDFRKKNAPVDETAKAEQNVPTEEDVAPVNIEDEQPSVESVIGDRDSFTSKQAMELYEEITSLKKGVRASKRLGYLLDHGYEWSSIKTALLNIRDNPNQVINPNSKAESAAREMISSEYDAMVEEYANADGVAKDIFSKMKHLRTELENNQRLREQSNADFDSEIARLQAEYEAKKNKNTKIANDILRRIERIQRLKGTVDTDYGKRIGKTEERLEKMSKPEYKTAMQRKAKQKEYTSLMENLVGDTSAWKDKKLGISYKINTLRRNLRDIVKDANGNPDIAKADAIYDELQGNYNRNEAELKRESMRIKKVFNDLKLNHAEDTYAHMLGEFWYNPDTTLTEETLKEFYNKNKDKMDRKKVETAIEESRKVFDDLIVRVNERLKEQGMKEIPYRKGYFPHFTNPKQGFLAKLFNWKPVDSEIPTSIAGLTEEFNPERSWQSFNKQRKGDTTDYSLEQGLDTYIHGALDWIYHIEDIQKRRALENHIRYVHSEEGVKKKVDEIRNSEVYDADEMQKQIDLVYAEANNPLNNFVTDLRAGTNTLANKKSSMDRKMEETTNRKIYSVMTNLNNRINANMVVGSISSALTNFIPITQSWMEVSPVYSLKGMRDTIKSTIRDDGVVNKSDFLTNRLMNEEKLYQTGWDKVTDKAAFMMEAIDSFTAQTVWRSKYLQNISEGMSENAAIKNADQFAENVIAGRSRGNQPTIFDAKNPITKIFTAFQLEVNNQYGYLFKDAPQDSKNKARLIKGYATAFLGAYAYNALYSSLVGRDAAFDPLSILEDLFGDLFGDDEEEQEDALLNLTSNVLEEVPFVGGLLGGGRVPLSSALPYNGDVSTMYSDITNGELSVKELFKPLYYLVLPVGGGQIKKTNEGLGMFSDDLPVSGSYTNSGKLRFPVEDTFGNRLQAGLFGQYASKNARDYFDNERSPLGEKQIQEYIDVDIPISDYWAYRDGLKGKDLLGEKIAYIDTLDLPISKKNILANNQANRDEPIDMAEFGKYGNLEEFDYAVKYPDKYKFLEANGISVKEYNDFDEDTKEAYTWAYQNPGKYTMSKVVSDDLVQYRTYTKSLNKIEADKYANGKTVSGSRKQKVATYINSLPLDYGQKIILFKSQYEADDSYNRDIVDYLNSRQDISYEQIVEILTELGFTVQGNNVYWD